MIEQTGEPGAVRGGATAPGLPLPAGGVHQLFAAQAARAPDRVALVFGDETLTYGELDERAERLAHRLRTVQVEPGQRIAVCAQRCPELIVAMLAIMKAGCAYVPLEPDDPPGRTSVLLADATPAVLLAQRALLDRLPPHTARTLALDDELPPAPASPVTPSGRAGADDVAYVMYTSGSTGRPKGVEVRHAGIVRLVCGQDFVSFGPGMTVLQLAPASFDASTFEIWAPLLHGGRCVLYPDRVPTFHGLGRAIARHRVTTLWLTATLFNAVIDEAPAALRGLRELLVGGEALSVPHVRRALDLLPDTRIVNGYGPTECTTFSCTHEIVRPLAGDVASIPIGRPIAHTDAHILGPDGAAVPAGAPGELHVGGPGLARGYLGRPDLTAEKFVDTRFGRLYRTGDKVRAQPGGALEFLGRLDDQIKIRGFRVEPGEVEAALRDHPAVREAVVTPREEAGERRLAAYVVPRSGDRTDGVVGDWERVFDEAFAESPDPAFNTAGWTSSYTGEPIPDDQMREWVESTVGRIRALRPRRILEIGCGTGLLLTRLAPACDSYVGTDISETTLRALGSHVRRAGIGNVTLVRADAGSLDWTQIGEPDVVVLNSVVQYFPDDAYLRRVVERALEAVRGRGAVFVGDVRSLPLLRAFHESVERFRGTPEGDVARRATQRAAQETELVVDPRFFETIPGAASVTVMTKRGQGDNEMSRFRYDVVLDARGATREPASHGGRLTNDPARPRLVPELRTFLQSRLPSHLVPASIVLLDELPLLRSGKVDRGALPPPDAHGPERNGDPAGPRTPLEGQLVAIWRETLGAEVGVHDDFFDLGGNSLLAAMVLNRCHERLGRSAPIRALFDAPTVAGLAARLTELAPEPAPARRGESVVPLSFAQERMWFLTQLLGADIGTPAWNIPFAYRLRGSLDLGALRRALDALVERHEPLRTTIQLVDGRPMQVVAEAGPADLRVRDVAGAGAAVREAATEMERGIDVSSGPVMRAALLRIGERDHVLVLTVHHLVSDGWSLGVMLRELSSLYAAFRRGVDSPLTPLALQYADWTLWQRETHLHALPEQVAYWQRQLKGQRPLELPTDRPRPDVRSFDGGTIDALLDDASAGALAKRLGVTLFMAVLAAFEIVLARRAGQDDLTLGVIVASRNRAEFENHVGLFANILVLRTDLSGDPSFADVVGRVRDATLEAYENQDLALDELLAAAPEALGILVDPRQKWILAQLFEAPWGDFALDGLESAPFEVRWGDHSGPVDIHLMLERTANRLVAHTSYSKELFDADTVAGIVDELVALLRAVADAPYAPLSELSVATRAAAQR